jgi:hypothetical protein
MTRFSSFKSFASILVIAVILIQPILSVGQRGRVEQLRRPVAKSVNQAEFTTRAETDGPGVLIRWRMASERGVLGYDVVRVGFGSLSKVNDRPVTANGIFGDETADTTFEHYIFDVEGGIGSFYRIDAQLLNGSTRVLGFVSANYVNDLGAVAPFPSSVYREAALAQRPDFTSTEPRYPKALATEIAASEIPASLAVNQWVAGQPGVKITVKREGFYRVTRAQLETAGFDVGVPGRFWRLFMDGVEQSIIVGPDDSYIDFYGRTQDTRESGEKVYFLIGDGIKGRRMAVRRSRPSRGTGVVETFNETVILKPRVEYFTNYRNGDAENYFGPVVATSEVSFSVNLPGIDPEAHQIGVTVKMQGVAPVPHVYDVRLLGGESWGTFNGSNTQNVSRTYSRPSAEFTSGTNVLRIKSNITGSASYLDSITVSYRRVLQLDQNVLKFYSGAGKSATVEGFNSPNARLFDVTTPDRPRILDEVDVTSGRNNTFSATFATDTARSIFALTDDGLLSPASIAPNTPSFLTDPSIEGHLLIVTHKNFRSEAENWATWRRSQGHSVYVADIEDVLDEFGYGTISTVGMRSFFQMASTSWADPARYVLLIGDASYDHRRYEVTKPFQGFVPTRLFDTFLEETASDDWLTDFNGDGIAEIPIGRLSVKVAGKVPIYLTKTQNFEAGVANGNGLEERGSVLPFDDPDSTLGPYPFDEVSARLAAKTPAGTPNVLVDRRVTGAKTALMSALNAGPFVSNYAGHGNLANWYNSAFFGGPDAAALTNLSRPTLFTMVTCLNGQFHLYVGDALAEILGENPNGGAAASWASTGKTTADVQDIMINRFFLSMSEGKIQRLGNLVIDAKSVVPGGRDVKLSWVIIGDPMLKVR